MARFTKCPSGVSVKIVKRPPYNLPKWYRPVLFSLVVEVFCLIALGGSVRLMNAGLACPDWPLCFGDVIPDYHPQVYLEFIHRVMAGVVAISTVVLTVTLVFFSRAPRGLKLLALFTTLLLAAQILFGALTRVVGAAGQRGRHALGPRHRLHRPVVLANPAPPPRGRGAGLNAQPLVPGAAGRGLRPTLLGGLVASRYAALACTEFPQCQNGGGIPLAGRTRGHSYFAPLRRLLAGGSGAS